MEVKRILRIAKDTILLLLLIAAFYQAIKLWFEEYSNYNFFYSFFTANNHSYNAEIYYLSTPAEIIANYGNKKFSRHFPSESTATLENSIRTTIKDILQYGQLVSSEEINWNNLLTAKSLIYNYHFQIPSADFIAALNANDNSAFKSVASFDMLIFSLSKNLPADIELILINTENNTATTIRSSKRNTTANKNAIDAIEKFQKENSADAYYISTVQQLSDNSIFKQNLFIPQFPGKNTAFPTLTFKLPLKNATGQQIEEFVDIFFDIPSIKDFELDKTKGIYRFSDQNVVVKYYTNGILEYSNYKTIGSDENRDLYLSYAAAYDFIMRDVTLKNAITLHDANFNGDSWTFYFNYNLNNYDVFLSTNEFENFGIKSLIEITAVGQNIKNYKRLVVNASSDNSQTATIETGFLDALNKIIEEDKNGSGIIDTLYLGYRIDSTLDGRLYWRVRSNGNWYSKLAQ